MGQMDYEVWKWLDNGEVEFRIHAVSKPAHIPNPMIRLGFRLFGRPIQARFAHRACQRMAQLTAATLGGAPTESVAAPVPRTSRNLTVARATDRKRTRSRLARHQTGTDH
jgi:hypothetical protein